MKSQFKFSWNMQNNAVCGSSRRTITFYDSMHIQSTLSYINKTHKIQIEYKMTSLHFVRHLFYYSVRS